MEESDVLPSSDSDKQEPPLVQDVPVADLLDLDPVLQNQEATVIQQEPLIPSLSSTDHSQSSKGEEGNGQDAACGGLLVDFPSGTSSGQGSKHEADELAPVISPIYHFSLDLEK